MRIKIQKNLQALAARAKYLQWQVDIRKAELKSLEAAQEKLQRQMARAERESN